MLFIGLLVLHVGYGFEGSFTKLGDYQFTSDLLSGQNNSPLNRAADYTFGNRFQSSVFGMMPVPLPRNYLLGIDRQRLDFEGYRSSYLCGVHQEGGWWSWYLFALGIKVPVGTWILAGMAAVVWSRGVLKTATTTAVPFLAVPALAIVLLASSQTGLSGHFRYVLPAMPFVYVWCSAIAVHLTVHSLRIAVLCLLSLGGVVVSSLAVYPHSLSYFNEVVGGPGNGPRYLLGSNVDWGQDLLFLKDWMAKNPQAHPMYVRYYGPVNMRLLGVEDRQATTSTRRIRPPPGDYGPQPLWYAVSINELFSDDTTLKFLRQCRPVAMAGYSIYVYHVTLNDANQIRRGLGLPELTDDK